MEVKKVEFKNYSKSGIVMFGGRLVSNRHNGYFSDEILPHMRKYILEELGRTTCDIITPILDRDKKLHLPNYYKDIDTINMNNYDEIFIFNSILHNFIGGLIPDVTIKTIKALLRFDGDVWYYLDDPDFGYKDIANLIKTRPKLKFGKESITEKELDEFTKKVSPRINVVWVGLDYEKYKTVKHKYSLQPHKKWAQILQAPYIFLKKQEIYKDYHFDREFDVMYYGKYKSDRVKLLNSYFKNENTLSKYWLGYDPGTNYNVNLLNEKGIKRNLLIDELCRSYSTLVIGSKAHNGNLVSPRYLECMSSDIISFIHYEYDDGSIIKDPYLRDMIIVKNIKEYKNKLNMIKKSEKLFREIVAAQRKEITNMNYLTLKN